MDMSSEMQGGSSEVLGFSRNLSLPIFNNHGVLRLWFDSNYKCQRNTLTSSTNHSTTFEGTWMTDMQLSPLFVLFLWYSVHILGI